MNIEISNNSNEPGEVVLPTNYPIATSFPYLTHILAIIQDIPDSITWYINHMIQLQINYDETFSSSNLSITFGDQINAFIKCPFIKTEILDKAFLKRNNISIYDFIVDCINNNKYICMPLDWFYLSCSTHYQKAHIEHEVLIYGYDKSSHNIYVADFFHDGTYSFCQCKLKELIDAYEYNQNKSCLLEDNIYIMKKTEEIYSFNINIAYEILNDYYYGFNSNYRFLPITRYMDFLSEDSFRFGLNVYSILIDYINFSYKNEKEITTRSFHVLYAHKIIIKKLIYYLIENGYLKYNTCIDEIDKIIFNALCIRNLAIKYNIKSNLRTASSIVEKLEFLYKYERKIFNYIVKNISKFPRLYRDNKEENYINDFKNICIDRITKGDGFCNYGTSGYDIFYKSYIPNNVKIVYYNFDYKVWSFNSESDYAIALKDSSQRVAICKFFKKNAYIDLLITENTIYKFTIYVLELGNMERIYDIKVYDGDTNEYIESVHINICNQGVYYRFEISGHIRLEFNNKSDYIGVISGVFFD